MVARAELRDLEAVNLVVTASCNLQCSYCYQNQKGPRRMSWKTLAAGLDLAADSSAEKVRVAFVGGEPLLVFPLIRRAVAHLETVAPGRRVQFSVITNGVLLAESGLRFLIDHDIDLRLSMDGIPAAQDLRGAGTFEILDRLLIRLRRDDPEYFRSRVSVGITLTPEAVSHLAESVGYFLDRRVPTIGITPVVTTDRYWRPERIEELETQFSEIHRLCLDHRSRTGETPLELLRRNGGDNGAANGGEISESGAADGGNEGAAEEGEISMCAAADARSLVVDVDGEALGCTLFTRFSQRKLPELLDGRLRDLDMGSIAGRGLSDRFRDYAGRIRADDLFRDRRAKYSSYGRCADCPHVADCRVCPVSIGHLLGNDDPHRVPDFSCGFFRTALSTRDRFPALATVSDIVSGGEAGPQAICERAAARSRPPK